MKFWLKLFAVLVLLAFIVGFTLLLLSRKGMQIATRRASMQGYDISRSYNNKGLGNALAEYYLRYKKAPGSLQELVTSGLIDHVPMDPVTHQPPNYSLTSDSHVCSSSVRLSSGIEDIVYCN